MPPKPRFQVRCARFCVDKGGAPRAGDQWVHIYGETLWVCASCAESLGAFAGIPTAAQKRRAVREQERKQQLRLEDK